MISLFAFIITLGIIVDDAVVAGEIIYQKREQGLPFVEAAIVGAREIAGPIMFAVLTNIAAFLPLFFVPGALAIFEAGSLGGRGGVCGVADRVLVRVAVTFGHTREPSGFWHTLDRPRLWFSKALRTFIRSATNRFSEVRSPITG